jgi:hypothetical protein
MGFNSAFNGLKETVEDRNKKMAHAGGRKDSE